MCAQGFLGFALRAERRTPARAQAQYTWDKRSIKVTTKDTAPGGRRTEKVGLPYDPELFDHMMEHGVFITARAPPARPPPRALAGG